jgi:acetyltransferase-like isoleucine patch superfamily enzyme
VTDIHCLINSKNFTRAYPTFAGTASTAVRGYSIRKSEALAVYIHDEVHKGFVNVSLFADKIGCRKIVAWGTTKKCEVLINYLKKFGLDVYAIVDFERLTPIICSIPVYSPDILEENSNKYYVIVPLDYDETIEALLSKFKYKQLVDYYFFNHAPVELASCHYYKDIWDNEIIGSIENKCTVKFKGHSAKLIVGNNVLLGNNVQFVLGSHSVVKIGNNCTIGENIQIESYYGNLTIGNNCNFECNGRIYICSGEITIADNFSTGFGFYFSAEKYTYISIEKDCMFSKNIHMLADNGHSIIDLTEKKNFAVGANRNIRIGEHVWIGIGTTILYNTSIGNGCVIGAASLVNNSFPNNSIIAGIPAKVIKTNIAWEKQNNIDYMEFIEKYGDAHNYSST